MPTAVYLKLAENAGLRRPERDGAIAACSAPPVGIDQIQEILQYRSILLT